MASGFAQGLEQIRNVLGIVLAVAIHANDVFVAELISQFVSGLDTSAQAQMIGQAEDIGAGRSGGLVRAVGGRVVDHQNGGIGYHVPHFADDAGHRRPPH